MMVRTQISLEAEDHRRAKQRAADLGISLAEYVRRALERDLDQGGGSAEADMSAIFALGNSPEPTDIARHKDAYVGEAVEAQHGRQTGRNTG